MVKKHTKHTALIKPTGGKFHSNEVSFIGAPCSTIQNLAKNISEQLEESIKLAYVDADHGEGSKSEAFFKVYTDKISRHSFDFERVDLEYRFRSLLSDSDGVLVNGNHFSADKQIVIINASKEESLKRKLDRLTHVVLFVLDEGMEDVFPFILEKYPQYSTTDKVSIEDLDQITEHISELFNESLPVVSGLVFAGGKSTRMGVDKGEVIYHSKPQREHIADLLSQFCEDVFISVAPESNIDTTYPTIEDTFTDLGPYGGILSAFRSNPNRAWLTVACDIPLLDEETLKLLLSERDPGKMATCFHNPDTKFPEPLITIWEPRAYSELLNFLAVGFSCPRKALINSSIKEVTIPDSRILLNANTPEERDAISGIISS